MVTSDLGVPADLLIHGVEGGQLVVQDVGGHLGDVGLVQVPANPLHLLQQPGLVQTQGEVTLSPPGDGSLTGLLSCAVSLVSHQIWLPTFKIYVQLSTKSSFNT